jgi:hypothetical protein
MRGRGWVGVFACECVYTRCVRASVCAVRSVCNIVARHSTGVPPHSDTARENGMERVGVFACVCVYVPKVHASVCAVRSVCNITAGRARRFVYMYTHT